MPIDFRNLNTLWASILVETLHRLGGIRAVICPGSRSAPLAIAFAQHPGVQAMSILDERTAAFFALGQSRQSGLPTVLVCTSGTAGANFYPAVIEAAESRVPLLILTGDRPPELRHTHAGQTIDQGKLYGYYPTWQTELTLPSIHHLQDLRQIVAYGWERTLTPIAGPVHLNVPFRDHLAPIPQADLDLGEADLCEEKFFDFLSSVPPLFSQPNLTLGAISTWQKSILSRRGIVIAGVAIPKNGQSYSQAIAHLAAVFQFPILAEGLSPLRNYAHLTPHLISTYDLILRHTQWAEILRPDVVIQIGDLPTSKVLRTWLEACSACHWVIDPTYQNLDPLHNQTRFLRCSVEEIVAGLNPDQISPPNPYLDQWCQLEKQARSLLDQHLTATRHLVEPKVAWLLSQLLPPKTPFFIANSTPVRDVEWFWCPNQRQIQPYFNRGANGIDGILSTALGMAHQNQPSVLLTGDLSLLYDTNGLLIRPYFQGHLTIVLINNQGGGIFEFLPIAQYNPPFEEFFATPQSIDFAQWCQTYQIDYERMRDWQYFQAKISILPTTGIRVLELSCDRRADAQFRKQLFQSIIDYWSSHD